jgi:hypothetical protein
MESGNICEEILGQLLAESGGNWEKVARHLCEFYPPVIAAREKERFHLAQSFNSSYPPKLGRKPRYTSEDIFDVLRRVYALKYNQLGKLRYESLKSALRDGLGFRGSKLARWEKILASLPRHIRQPWKSAQRHLPQNRAFIETSENGDRSKPGKN